MVDENSPKDVFKLRSAIVKGPKIMLNMLKSLKLVGLWKQDRPSSLRHPSTLLFILSALFIANNCLAEFAYTFTKSTSILDTAEALGPAIGTLGPLIKFFDLFVYRKQFFKLLKNLQDAFDERSGGKYSDLVLNYHRRAKRVFDLYFCLLCLIVLAFVIIPIVIYGFQLLFGLSKYADLQLPFRADLLYTSGLANHLLIDYFILLIGSITVVLSLAPLDCYVGCACLYIIPHFKILKQDLQDISYEVEETQRSDVARCNLQLRSEVYVKGRLIQFIKDHGRAISFVDQLEEVCNRQMMVHFIYNTLVCCLVLFEATLNSDNIMTLISYGFFMIGSFNQLLICTYYGQELLNETSQLDYAVYNVAWFDKSVEFKRLIPFVLMRAQKPLGITAFKYTHVSIATFATVLKTVMSYFTLLQQVTEDVMKNGS